MISINERSERIQELATLQQQIAVLSDKIKSMEEDKASLIVLIRKARRSPYNVRATDLADLTGFTRQRIWQLCDSPAARAEIAAATIEEEKTA